MTEITLKITDIESRPPKGNGVVGIYNLILEGSTINNESPGIRGLRLFKSDKDDSYYLRLPQIQLKNGRPFNLIKLPTEEFRQLEALIVDHYLSNKDKPITDEEIEQVQL